MLKIKYSIIILYFGQQLVIRLMLYFKRCSNQAVSQAPKPWTHLSSPVVSGTLDSWNWTGWSLEKCSCRKTSCSSTRTTWCNTPLPGLFSMILRCYQYHQQIFALHWGAQVRWMQMSTHCTSLFAFQVDIPGQSNVASGLQQGSSIEQSDSVSSQSPSAQ